MGNGYSRRDTHQSASIKFGKLLWKAPDQVPCAVPVMRVRRFRTPRSLPLPITQYVTQDKGHNSSWSLRDSGKSQKTGLFVEAFGGEDDIHYVDFKIHVVGPETWRKTTVTLADIIQAESEMTPIWRG